MPGFFWCSSGIRAALAAFAFLIFFTTFFLFLRLNNGQREGQVPVKIKRVGSIFHDCLTLFAHATIDLWHKSKPVKRGNKGMIVISVQLFRFFLDKLPAIQTLSTLISLKH